MFLATSAERPPSASSIRGTRQRLQHPNTRRVHASENEKNISTIDTRTSPATIVTISSIEAQPIVEDVTDKPNTQESVPITNPLKQLIFKKINNGPVEVKLLFSNIWFFSSLT